MIITSLGIVMPRLDLRVGRAGAYLFRESDVKAGMLCYDKSSSVAHILVPKSDGKFFSQSLRLSSSHCQQHQENEDLKRKLPSRPGNFPSRRGKQRRIGG